MLVRYLGIERKRTSRITLRSVNRNIVSQRVLDYASRVYIVLKMLSSININMIQLLDGSSGICVKFQSFSTPLKPSSYKQHMINFSNFNV